jgi:membrane associated rhomboid family serine protease
MLPYHDENIRHRPAYVTAGLIGINVLVWLVVQGAGSAERLAASVCNFGLIPGELMSVARPGARFPLTDSVACVIEPGRQVSHVLTSMFLHGSWMHLLGNMWFLWLFGNNIEDSMTHSRFVLFYTTCGVAAALLQVISRPASIAPIVGASGAISGVMGAYLVLYPHARVFTFVPLGFFITTIALPAWVMLLYWAIIQLASGLGDVISTAPGAGSVAFWAHIGGFLTGTLLVKLFQRADHVAQHASQPWRPRGASS